MEHQSNALIVIQVSEHGYSMSADGLEFHHLMDVVRQVLADLEAQHVADHEERGDWEEAHGVGLNGSEATTAIGGKT